MIIVKLKGGLGNQMFQYSLARSVSEEKKLLFKIDIRWFDNQRLRSYGLDKFNIIDNIASEEDIKKIIPINRFFLYFFKKRELLINWNKRRFIEQLEWSYNPEIMNTGDNVYFDGYWQSEKYFKNISEIIINEFSLKNDFQINSKDYLNIINGSNSVSIHVRRGDYLTTPNILNLDLNYYKKAISIVNKKINNPKFFLFSDDLNWCKGVFKFLGSDVNFVQGFDDFESLGLMKACKHNIIANSSFSWWGAWLNRNTEKIVIAPDKWGYYERQGRKPKKDMIPEEWIII